MTVILEDHINEISSQAIIIVLLRLLGDIFSELVAKMSHYLSSSFQILEPLTKKLANLPEYSAKGTTPSTTTS